MPDIIEIIERHSSKWAKCVEYVLSRSAHSKNKDADPIAEIEKKYTLLKNDKEYLKLLMFLKTEFFDEMCDLDFLKGHVDEKDMWVFREMEKSKKDILNSKSQIDDMLSVLG